MTNGQAGEVGTAVLGVAAAGARLLDDVSIRIGKGEFVGIVGPNGAGKSTLLRVISRLMNATEGTVSIEGAPAGKLRARDIARTLAIVGQHAPDTHGFTALEVVLTGRYPHLGRFEVESETDRDFAVAAMERTATLRFADRSASSLSGGERQRVFVARGLAQQPRILLLDEPTASLDVFHQFAVMDLAREMAASGVTVVAVIHDLRMAARYCDRLVLLDHGRVAADGPPEAVLTPANLERVFGMVASVFTDPLSGGLMIDFAARPPERSGERLRIHVVGGYGQAAPLLRELRIAGHEVTAGPLGAGDIDRLGCQAVGVPFLPVPGFVPIDDETHERHIELVAAADCTVLCDIPFGMGNVRNLEALRGARNLLSIEAGPFVARDYTGGIAERIFSDLRISGRFTGPSDVIAAIEQLSGPGTEAAGHEAPREEAIV